MEKIMELAEGLATADLEKLITKLGQLRATRQPMSKVDLDVGESLDVQIDPRYRIDLHAISGATVLSLRHPGLGYVSFLLPPQSRLHILNEFQKHEDQLAAIAAHQSAVAN